MMILSQADYLFLIVKAENSVKKPLKIKIFYLTYKIISLRTPFFTNSIFNK